jgi:PIN domain nuclease of toxin-antitoxin system
LGRAASSFIDRTIAEGNHIRVSAISLAEMVYLIEKGRIPAGALRDVHAATADPQAVLKHVPVDESVAMKMAEIPREHVPDLPDRVIAATGLLYAVPVLSRDGKIKSSSVKTIW